MPPNDATTVAWCSWCYQQTKHVLVERNRVPGIRHQYRCMACEGRTFRCRMCENMARGRPQSGKLPDPFFANLVARLDDEFCAEHDGTIAAFERLGCRLPGLEGYKELFRREKTNMVHVARTAGVSLGGLLLFAPVAYAAAPAIASALGAVGVLGAAGTGTAIAGLSGAALTSASLAAIGGGLGVAGGTVFLSAAGAALGAYKGGVISNAYFGAVEGFKIRRIQWGRGPAVVVINGFLTEKDDDTRDWERGLESKFADNPWYHVQWESKRLYDIGKMIGGGVANVAFKGLVEMLAKRASRAAANPVGAAGAVADLIDNPWHAALVRASKTGILLADLLARTDHEEGFILLGHSLGARVAYYALEALSTKPEPVVREAYVLGGAVGRIDTEGWSAAARAVSDRIVNAYSDKDDVLRYLYKTGCAFQSEPVGLGPIDADPAKIMNVDVSDVVKGHTEHKLQLSQILSRASEPKRTRDGPKTGTTPRRRRPKQ